jgi:transcription initiation factor TFIIIB Brf1 subunit/transcription initiation factor TFIIB
MIKNIKQVKECPECASDNLIYKEDKQQVICKDCGCIYEPLTPKEEEKFEKGHKFTR